MASDTRAVVLTDPLGNQKDKSNSRGGKVMRGGGRGRRRGRGGRGGGGGMDVD